MSRRTDPSDWMWAEACSLMERAERMQRRFFQPARGAQARGTWEPPADVFEDEREIVVVVALPGVAAEGVQVTLEGGALAVRAERPPVTAAARHAIRQLEIPYGSFERRIPLPAVRLESATHELSHGCLVVRLRKSG